MTSIFIFAGTSEGRELAEILSQNDFDCTVSVATEYGASLLPHGKNLTVLQGRLSHEQMAEKLSQKKYDFVIDATHPFATEVSKEIAVACKHTQNRYLRLARKTNPPCRTCFDSSESEQFFYFIDISSAGEWLESQQGRIFVTTGSKELPILAQKISDKSRLFVRVLPTVESLEICAKCGIVQKQIIAMQGAFSERMNEVQFSESGAKILLTKESGSAGGFFEKIAAAEKLGMKIAVIRNPEARSEQSASGERFSSVEEVVRRIRLSIAR